MKKQFVAGMVLTAVFSMNAWAVNGKTKMNETHERYTKTRAKAIFNGNETSGGLDAVAMKKAQDSLMKELDIPAADSNGLESVRQGKDAAKVTDAMNAAAAEKKLGEKRLSENKEVDEANSFVDSSKAAVKSMSVLGLLGLPHAKPKKLTMDADTVKLGAACSSAFALNVTNHTGSMTQLGRNKYTNLREEQHRLITKEGLMPEEASIQAIMNVLKVDFETAKKIARKIVSDC